MIPCLTHVHRHCRIISQWEKQEATCWMITVAYGEEERDLRGSTRTSRMRDLPHNINCHHQPKGFYRSATKTLAARPRGKTRLSMFRCARAWSQPSGFRRNFGLLVGISQPGSGVSCAKPKLRPVAPRDRGGGGVAPFFSVFSPINQMFFCISYMHNSIIYRKVMCTT